MQDEALDQLLPYAFIKMEGGTGIVSLAATEHLERIMCRRNAGLVLPAKVRDSSSFSASRSRG